MQKTTRSGGLQESTSTQYITIGHYLISHEEKEVTVLFIILFSHFRIAKHTCILCFRFVLKICTFRNPENG